MSATYVTALLAAQSRLCSEWHLMVQRTKHPRVQTDAERLIRLNKRFYPSDGITRFGLGRPSFGSNEIYTATEYDIPFDRLYAIFTITRGVYMQDS